VLRIMRPADLITRTAAALDDAARRVGAIDLLLTFSCIARHHEVERHGKRDALDRIYARSPIIGFSSFGEQFGPLLVNHSLVALAIANSDEAS
jgi:hypothetical protein